MKKSIGQKEKKKSNRCLNTHNGTRRVRLDCVPNKGNQSHGTHITTGDIISPVIPSGVAESIENTF